MPGICAVVELKANRKAVAWLHKMLQSMRHYSWYACQAYQSNDGRAAIGLVTSCPIHSSLQEAVSDDGCLAVMLHGELYDTEGVEDALRSAGVRLEKASQAELLLHGYQKIGRAFFRGLNGRFVAVIWDGNNSRLVVVNDRFGMKPTYFAKLSDCFLVASEIKALFSTGRVAARINLRGLAQFLSFGQYLGEDTLYEAVYCLPPATWLEYDATDGRLAVDRYWQLQTPSADEVTQAELLERTNAAFRKAVERRLVGGGRIGLSLSGGLDARTILAVVSTQRSPITTVVLGIPGSADHRSASQMAKLVGAEHHNYVIGPDFLTNFESHFRQMVYLTDGQYLSQCVEMPTLPFYRELGIEVLLRGHAGELMHMSKAYNYSLDRQSLALQTEADLAAWAFSHLRTYMLEGVDGRLVVGADRRDLEALARDSLLCCLRQSEDVSPPVHRIWHLFLTQRLHREVALSLAEFDSVVETRLPYLDNELVDCLMLLPPAAKLGDTIQSYILRRNRPEFLGVVNVNTGARVGAGPVACAIASFKQRVYAKLAIAGYQPYERLGLWLRRQLRPMVEGLLLSERCRQRGLLDPGTLKSVVEHHMDNRRNHTFLLLALMVVELGQRMFADGSFAEGVPQLQDHPNGKC